MKIAQLAAIIGIALSNTIADAEPSPSWADLYVLDLNRGVVGLTPVVGDLTAIDTVEPDSPAAAAGLQKFDHIVAIDGGSTSDIKTFRDLRIRIDGAPNSVVELTVTNRAGHTRGVPLKRVPLGSLARVKARPNTLLSYFLF